MGIAYVVFTQLDDKYMAFFILVVFLGRLTTFSTFSLEIVNLVRVSNIILAMKMISFNFVGSLFMTFLGILLATWFRKV